MYNSVFCLSKIKRSTFLVSIIPCALNITLKYPNEYPNGLFFSSIPNEVKHFRTSLCYEMHEANQPRQILCRLNSSCLEQFPRHFMNQTRFRTSSALRTCNIKDTFNILCLCSMNYMYEGKKQAGANCQK